MSIFIDGVKTTRTVGNTATEYRARFNVPLGFNSVVVQMNARASTWANSCPGPTTIRVSARTQDAHQVTVGTNVNVTGRYECRYESQHFNVYQRYQEEVFETEPREYRNNRRRTADEIGALSNNLDAVARSNAMSNSEPFTTPTMVARPVDSRSTSHESWFSSRLTRRVEPNSKARPTSKHNPVDRRAALSTRRWNG